MKNRQYLPPTYLRTSVTRLGDLLDFGQIFKICGNNLFPQISHILGNFCKGVKIYRFSSEINFRQLLQTFGNFFWSHCCGRNKKHKRQEKKRRFDQKFRLDLEKSIFRPAITYLPAYCSRKFRPSSVTRCCPKTSSNSFYLKRSALKIVQILPTRYLYAVYVGICKKMYYQDLSKISPIRSH